MALDLSPSMVIEIGGMQAFSAHVLGLVDSFLILLLVTEAHQTLSPMYWFKHLISDQA